MFAGLTKCPWTLVAIHWIDAFDSENGWIHTSTYKPRTQHVISVGWLWPDLLDGYLSVTCSWCPDEETEMDTVGMVTHVPVGMVQKVVVLNPPNV